VPEPGWYDDPQDPQLLRWFDGVQWTNQTGPKATVGWPDVRQDPAWGDPHPTPAASTPPPVPSAYAPVSAAATGVPPWVKVAGPPLAALVLVAVLAFFVLGRDDDDTPTAAATTTTEPAAAPVTAAADIVVDEPDEQPVIDADDVLPGTAADGGCPSIAEERRDETLDVVARYGTSRFLVWICEGRSGLTYHGQRRAGDPATDSLTVAAQRTTSGYTATNAGTRFDVDGSALQVTNAAGEQIVDDPVLDFEAS
jgi:hypothetical protein